MKQDPLKSLRIAAPCPVGWERMAGDNRVRFCSECNLHVYNIAELTRKEATDLITATEGRLCGRIYRRSDGTVITKDCPIGLGAIRRRMARVSGAIFAGVVALSSAVFGQKPTQQKDSSCKQQVTISRKQTEGEASVITGTILDTQGAVVPGARIKVIDQTSKKSSETTSDDEGCFRIAISGPGPYNVIAESPGFDKLEVRQLTVGLRESVSLVMIPTPTQTTVLVGIIGYDPLIDTSKPGGTTIITGDMMRRLPIPE